MKSGWFVKRSGLYYRIYRLQDVEKPEGGADVLDVVYENRAEAEKMADDMNKEECERFWRGWK